MDKESLGIVRLAEDGSGWVKMNKESLGIVRLAEDGSGWFRGGLE